MKITYDWLKEHLQTKNSENQLINKLTDIGLEVESVEVTSSDLEKFLVAKVIKTEKHPNADRLKVCEVDFGKKETVKVVCGASNAKEGLLTIYAPPGAIIPKNKMKLVVKEIRGVTSFGMLRSESELNLSDESDGICELNKNQFKSKIGQRYFTKKKSNLIDLSITPNRPDCLGVRGIARDLATAGFGKLKGNKIDKILSKDKQKIKIKKIFYTDINGKIQKTTPYRMLFAEQHISAYYKNRSYKPILCPPCNE
jgi:phenylalanyl-tRNA synthetase beta chain